MTDSPDFLIYGLGRSGRGVARFLGREGLRAEWLDARPQEEDLALARDLGFERGDVSRAYRTVVAAPGVPIDHPDLARLRAAGAEVIGEAELAYRFRDVPIVGVTGTAGKGGTSSLIEQLLVALGVRARLGGNFDPPLLDVVDGAEVAVAELSSFQLERVQAFRPVVAVITNLGVDHLDRHGTVEAYHEAKRHITRAQTSQDTLVLPDGLSVPTRARTLHFTAGRVAL
ncbi:Mur ligase family protein, partial [Deinococcus pimensis]|uniref:Mur ligase family protein n=1 Tax=Deinococcus pimensis TaxID=309888 RepID=UPI0005EB6197